MPEPNRNSKVDAYIQKSRPFAQPILVHLRKAIHAGCPGAEETIKWSRPFFEYRGVILCNMSAFRSTAASAFGVWKSVPSCARPAWCATEPWARSAVSPASSCSRLRKSSLNGSLRPRLSSKPEKREALLPPALASSSRPARRSKHHPTSTTLSERTKRPQPPLLPSAPVAAANTLTGSSMPSAPRPASSASPRPSLGSLKANSAIGNTKGSCPPVSVPDPARFGVPYSKILTRSGEF